MASVVKYIDPTDLKPVRERKRVVVDREIERLYKEHGKVEIEHVLDAARSAKSPLHSFFDWDDTVAAEKWRRTQALHLIMQSKIIAEVIENGNKKLPAAKAETAQVRRLVSAFRGEGFKMRNEALDDAEQRKAIVAKKLSVLRSWVSGTVDIIELATLRAQITKLLPKSDA